MSHSYKIMRECLFLLLAAAAMYTVSAYFAPSYTSPDMMQATGKAGWPMAYWMKTWDDLGNNKGFEKSTFYLFPLIIDLFLFYFVLRLASLGVVYMRKR